MRVYRLENWEGQGPYQDRHSYPGDGQPAFLRDLYASDSMDPDPHPAPSADGIEYPVRYNEFFACASPEALAAWFFREPQDAPLLEGINQWVTIWEVDPHDVRHGGRQVVFYRERATLVEEHRPTDYARMLDAQEDREPADFADPEPMYFVDEGSWRL